MRRIYRGGSVSMRGNIEWVWLERLTGMQCPIKPTSSDVGTLWRMEVPSLSLALLSAARSGNKQLWETCWCRWPLTYFVSHCNLSTLSTWRLTNGDRAHPERSCNARVFELLDEGEFVLPTFWWHVPPSSTRRAGHAGPHRSASWKLALVGARLSMYANFSRASSYFR